MRGRVFTYKEYGRNGRWCKVVPIDLESLPDGNYDIAPARLLGLNYNEYLQLLAEVFPNRVAIREESIPVPYWLKSKELFTFIDLLNKRWTLAQLNASQGDEVTFEQAGSTYVEIVDPKDNEK